MDEIEVLEKEEMHEIIQNELSSAFGSGATSFEQLEEVGKARRFYDDIRALTTVATILLDNISWRFSPEANNKENIALIKKAVADYTVRLDALMNDDGSEEQKSLKEKTIEFISKMLGGNKDENENKEQNFKTDGGKKYYASDYLYVPDKSKPSTWKLRIADGGTGKVTIAQLGRAAAAFSSGGFRGNKVELPSGEASRIKAKLRAKYRSLGVSADDMPESIRKEQDDTIMFFKQADGSYRWLASHTNNFQDTDEDILSKDSHNKFVDMVDKGEVDYPELWHWHVPGTAWGKADMVAFDNDTGMMLSSGIVYKGHEAEAEALSELPYAIGVSHGMPKTSVRRDPDDPHVITEYITREISDLPLVNAANRLTHFVIHKEEVMPIPAAKKDYLKSVGIPDEVIDGIEATMQKSSDEAKKDGIVSKEAEGAVEETTTETTSTEDTTAEVGEEQTEDEAVQAESESKEKDEQPLTKEDIAAAVAESVGAIFTKFETVVKELRGEVTALSNEMSELKKEKAETDEKKEQGNLTPSSSLAAMIARNLSAASSDDTVIRKNATLSKEAPVETDPEKAPEVIGGNPMLNSVISNIIRGGNSTPTQ